MVAAIAVLAVSDEPLLAAKLWCSMTVGTLFESLIEADRLLAERPLAAVRRATDAVAFELAVKEGRNAGADSVMDEVLARLDLIAAPARRASPGLQHGVLTRRELEVLALVGAGRSDSEIAAALYISPKTASVHVSNAKAKLGVDSRLEAALWARERGLVDSQPDRA